MARRIKFDAICFYCKKMCKKGHGYLHRQNGKWYAHCDECYKSNKENK